MEAFDEDESGEDDGKAGIKLTSEYRHGQKGLGYRHPAILMQMLVVIKQIQM